MVTEITVSTNADKCFLNTGLFIIQEKMIDCIVKSKITQRQSQHPFWMANIKSWTTWKGFSHLYHSPKRLITLTAFSRGFFQVKFFKLHLIPWICRSVCHVIPPASAPRGSQGHPRGVAGHTGTRTVGHKDSRAQGQSGTRTVRHMVNRVNCFGFNIKWQKYYL